MVATILAIVGGGLITIVTAIAIENWRRPALSICLCDPQELDYTGRGKPANKMYLVHLELSNKPLCRWIRWMSRNSAIQCHGTISFHHLDGQNVFGRAMPIRWGRSPEPVPVTVECSDRAIIVYNQVVGWMRRMDVHPGEGEIFNVAARFDAEEECYGWNNDSYYCTPVWRNPEWKLGRGRFLVKVTVNSAGEKCTGLFRLINDAPVGDFRIEAARPGDAAAD